MPSPILSSSHFDSPIYILDMILHFFCSCPSRRLFCTWILVRMHFLLLLRSLFSITTLFKWNLASYYELSIKCSLRKRNPTQRLICNKILFDLSCFCLRLTSSIFCTQASTWFCLILVQATFLFYKLDQVTLTNFWPILQADCQPSTLSSLLSVWRSTSFC